MQMLLLRMPFVTARQDPHIGRPASTNLFQKKKFMSHWCSESFYIQGLKGNQRCGEGMGTNAALVLPCLAPSKHLHTKRHVCAALSCWGLSSLKIFTLSSGLTKSSLERPSFSQPSFLSTFTIHKQSGMNRRIDYLVETNTVIKVSVSSSGSQGAQLQVKQPLPHLVTRQGDAIGQVASEALTCRKRASISSHFTLVYEHG